MGLGDKHSVSGARTSKLEGYIHHFLDSGGTAGEGMEIRIGSGAVHVALVREEILSACHYEDWASEYCQVLVLRGVCRG